MPRFWRFYSLLRKWNLARRVWSEAPARRPRRLFRRLLLILRDFDQGRHDVLSIGVLVSARADLRPHSPGAGDWARASGAVWVALRRAGSCWAEVEWWVGRALDGPCSVRAGSVCCAVLAAALRH